MNSPFFEALARQVAGHGGLHNAHLHLDRSNTLHFESAEGQTYDVMRNSSVSLRQKHGLIHDIHSSGLYEKENLIRRVAQSTQVMIACGTRVADTVVDVTPDNVGLTALTWIQEYATSVADKITLRAASYTPWGFSDAEPERWDIFEKGAEQSDFIGSLPEADDRDTYPDKIGFDEHCDRVLALARRHGKMLQVHTDQRNVARENGTERLLDAIERMGAPLLDEAGDPLVWAVHVISPSTYDNARWQRFVARMNACRVGVICCPSGAVGMRQIRPIHGPTYNSIARVLDLAAEGVPIRLGSDNIADMLSPTTTADLTDEVYMLSAALRYYDVDILAKFAAGCALDAQDRAKLKDHLKSNDLEIQKVVERWS